MRDTMLVRGPDEAGLAQLPGATLGFRRLSILDLSPAGHQPMTNEDESLWLVFNGEIYNFESLRQELVGKGYAFASRSDSEVLLHGYAHWGLEELLERVNGMFAFAIWDVAEQRLSMARDRTGKKPLFHASLGGRFLFASDIKAIWRVCADALTVSEESLARFLYWGSVPGSETVWSQIRQLPPAHCLTLDAGGLSIRPYWRLSFAYKERGSDAELLEQTREVVSGAVKRRLRSDVPLGAFLSGGVDSSYVVSWMARHSPERVRTYCAAFDDPHYDEAPVARAVAEHLGTRHSELPVSVRAWEMLPRLVWEFGQPFVDPAVLPLYGLSREASRHITVVLTGDGGDETFCGYSHHQGYYRAAALRRALPGALLDGLVRRLSPRISAGARGRGASLLRFLRYASSDERTAWCSPDAWTLDHLERIWSPERRGLVDAGVLLGFLRDALRHHDGLDALDWAQAFDFAMLLPYRYNVKLDVATMASSLEARCPLLDTEVVEWAARLPARLRIAGSRRKVLLRRAAAEHVPREILERPKHGFGVPLDEWFRADWREPAEEILFSEAARGRGWLDLRYAEALWREHQAGTRRHGVRFLMLLWLELWCRFFVDRSLAPPQAEPARASA